MRYTQRQLKSVQRKKTKTFSIRTKQLAQEAYTERIEMLRS